MIAFLRPLSRALLKLGHYLSLRVVSTLIKMRRSSLGQMMSRVGILRKLERMEKKFKSPAAQYMYDALKTAAFLRAKDPLYDGGNIVILDDEIPWAIGNGGEDYCQINGYDGTLVHVTKGFATSHQALYVERDRVVTMHDFKALISKLPKDLFPCPKFDKDQVVYVAGSKWVKPDQSNPIVGSEFESDVKILSVDESKFELSFNYRVIIPGVGVKIIPEQRLLSVEEKYRYIYNDYSVRKLAVDALPFFAAGEEVLIYNNTVNNRTGTVTVPLTEELKTLFQTDKLTTVN